MPNILQVVGGSQSKAWEDPEGREGARAPKGEGRNENPYATPHAEPQFAKIVPWARSIP